MHFFWRVVFSLGDFLHHFDHLGRANALRAGRTNRVYKQAASRARDDVFWDGNAIALECAGPADEDGVWLALVILKFILANGRQVLAVGFPGLLLQELVDCLLLFGC